MQFHGNPESIRRVEPWSDGGRKFCKQYGTTYELIDGDKSKNEITIRCLEYNNINNVISVRKDTDGKIYVNDEFYCDDWDHNVETFKRKLKEDLKKSSKTTETTETTDDVKVEVKDDGVSDD